MSDNPTPEGMQPQPPQPQPQQQTEVVVDDTGALPSYSNFCRVTATPEEVILDFGLNPQPFATGKQEVKANQRIVMNFYTSKRLLTALGMTIQHHEQTFGSIELDVRRRAGSAQQHFTAAAAARVRKGWWNKVNALRFRTPHDGLGPCRPRAVRSGVCATAGRWWSATPHPQRLSPREGGSTIPDDADPGQLLLPTVFGSGIPPRTPPMISPAVGPRRQVLVAPVLANLWVISGPPYGRFKETR